MLKLFMKLPLRFHLVVMASLLAVPALLLILYTFWFQSRELVAHNLIASQRSIHIIASEQESLADNAEQLLLVLAQLPDVQNRNAAAVNLLLSNILKKSPQFGNIVIADRSGDVWASGLPMSAPFSLKDKRTFRHAVKTKAFSSGEYSVGKFSARPTIGFGFPILQKNGEISGVIAVNINFKHFNQSLVSSGLQKEAILTLYDSEGIILNKSVDADKYVGTKENANVFQSIVEGPETHSHIESSSDSIVSFQKLSIHSEAQPYLYATVSIPLNEVTKKAVDTLIHDLIVLSLILVVVVLMAVMLGRYLFITPLNKLQDAVQRLAEGDLQFNVADAVRGKELGALGQAFNEMAKKLNLREQSLLGVQDELTQLNDNLSLKIEEETNRRMNQERLLTNKFLDLSQHMELEWEQKRLALSWDIHDDIGQHLTALKLNLALIGRKCDSNCELTIQLGSISEVLDILIKKVQNISADLRPPLLDNLGLVPAMEWQVQEFQRLNEIECFLRLDEEATCCDEQIGTSIIRILQESLANISRHAKASTVFVSFQKMRDHFILEVRDNGIGVTPGQLDASDSFGVMGMHERARLCHGELFVTGVPGEGTTVTLKIPVNQKGSTV